MRSKVLKEICLNAILLALLIAIVRDMYEKNGKGLILNKICKIYVDVIRGTPALLQLMIIPFS